MGPSSITKLCVASAMVALVVVGGANAKKSAPKVTNKVFFDIEIGGEKEGRIEMGEKVIINIKTFADGHRPPDRVIPAIL